MEKTPNKKPSPNLAFWLLVVSISAFYAGLSWLVSGGQEWWILDIMRGHNVFYGDDAYRFFLAKSAFSNPELYRYNFVLPAALVLDGAISFILSGDLFSMRVAHGVLVALALACLWRTGKRIAIPSFSLSMMVVILILSPRFSFLSISFYGEMWLGAAVCFMLLFAAEKKWLCVAIIAGLTPLMRPEGIFFVATLFVYFVRSRAWREIAILLLPGVVYALHIIYAFYPDLQTYLDWRMELRKVLNNLLG